MIQRKLRRSTDRLLCIFDDGTVSIENVLGIDGNVLETTNRVLNICDLDKFVDVSGSVFYATNLDIAARSESEDLKKLRRSIVVKNIFSYSGGKKLDLMGILPWIIVAISIIFG